MKNLPLEKLVLEKSDKKQIREFLESLGRWKNISSGYSFFYKCLREAKNEENMLDDLIDFLEIDSEEFQKAIDKTEKIIQEAIENLLVNRTVIVIAHRLSTIINADTILLIDNGKIIDEGSHQELINRDGVYKELHNMQFQT